MNVEAENKDAIRHQALLEVIQIFGGVTPCSKFLNISRTRVSNWCHKPKMYIPYQYVIMMHYYTGVSLERLSPFNEIANKMLKKLCANEKSAFGHIAYKALNKILLGDHYYLKHSQKDRQIIVGADDVLISGLAQIKKDQASGIKKRLVMILDLEALLLDNGSFRDMHLDLLISEQIAIGLRLEQLLSNRQGQRNELSSTQKNSIASFKGRKDIRVSKIMGYSTNTYYRAKKVYLEGNSKLINMLDRKEISIAMAAEQIQQRRSMITPAKQ